MLKAPAVASLIVLAIGCSQREQALPVTTANDLSASGGDGHTSSPQKLEIVDIEGVTHRPFADSQVKAVVFVFVVPDCPISNSYIPELNRLNTDYGSRGVRLFLIHVDPQTSIDEAREHSRQYQIQAPVVLDKRHVWVRKIGATVTPQTAVLLPAGTVQYLGRIDNRYAGFGKRREQVTSYDLRDALDAILAGGQVSQSRTEAVGCDIPDVPTGE